VGEGQIEGEGEGSNQWARTEYLDLKVET